LQPLIAYEHLHVSCFAEHVGTMHRRLLLILVCLLLIGSCAHLRMAGVRPGGGQRFYYSATEYLNYEVVGGGPLTLLFLHGFGASLRTWDDVLACIPGDRFTSYLIDLKGFGLSSKPRDAHYAIRDNAALVSRFIMEKKLENVVLVGHSMGGGVALAVAVESLDTERTPPAAMVLIDPAAYATKPPFFVKFSRMPVVGTLLLSLTGSEFKARFVLKRLIYDHNKITAGLVDRYAVFVAMDGFNYALYHTAADLLADDHGGYTGNYGRITCPVLVIWGAEDKAIPLVSGDQLVSDMPNAQLHTIEQCGHNPHEEFPEEVASLIVASAVEAVKVVYP
jgi:pimeloyl-ACP methyl ester carboxylesterase